MELVTPRIVAAGEGMLELSRGEGDGWQFQYGGDTLNMAVHLARFGEQVGYFTALGEDPFSTDLRDTQWPEEGIDTSLVLRDPKRSPGLYAITNDAAGERQFTYWRNGSAASAMFDHPDAEAAAERCADAALFVYSLISLAILDEGGRGQLVDLARRVRAKGGRVAFDGNYRPRLWEDQTTAQRWRDRAVAEADFGLPTIEDEVLMGGSDDADAVAAQWSALGCGEVVVKLGPEGCRLPDGTRSAPKRLDPVDTSGAGDAFGAGYLAGRLSGLEPDAAAGIGHRLAGWVLMRRGAIPARDEAAPYALA